MMLSFLVLLIQSLLLFECSAGLRQLNWTECDASGAIVLVASNTSAYNRLNFGMPNTTLFNCKIRIADVLSVPMYFLGDTGRVSIVMDNRSGEILTPCSSGAATTTTTSTTACPLPSSLIVFTAESTHFSLNITLIAGHIAIGGGWANEHLVVFERRTTFISGVSIRVATESMDFGCGSRSSSRSCASLIVYREEASVNTMTIDLSFTSVSSSPPGPGNASSPPTSATAEEIFALVAVYDNATIENLAVALYDVASTLGTTPPVFVVVAPTQVLFLAVTIQNSSLAFDPASLGELNVTELQRVVTSTLWQRALVYMEVMSPTTYYPTVTIQHCNVILYRAALVAFVPAVSALRWYNNTPPPEAWFSPTVKFFASRLHAVAVPSASRPLTAAESRGCESPGDACLLFVCATDVRVTTISLTQCEVTLNNTSSSSSNSFGGSGMTAKSYVLLMFSYTLSYKQLTISNTSVDALVNVSSADPDFNKTGIIDSFVQDASLRFTNKTSYQMVNMIYDIKNASFRLLIIQSSTVDAGLVDSGGSSRKVIMSVFLMSPGSLYPQVTFGVTESGFGTIQQQQQQQQQSNNNTALSMTKLTVRMMCIVEGFVSFTSVAVTQCHFLATATGVPQNDSAALVATTPMQEFVVTYWNVFANENAEINSLSATIRRGSTFAGERLGGSSIVEHLNVSVTPLTFVTVSNCHFNASSLYEALVTSLSLPRVRTQLLVVSAAVAELSLRVAVTDTVFNSLYLSNLTSSNLVDVSSIGHESLWLASVEIIFTNVSFPLITFEGTPNLAGDAGGGDDAVALVSLRPAIDSVSISWIGCTFVLNTSSSSSYPLNVTTQPSSVPRLLSANPYGTVSIQILDSVVSVTSSALLAYRYPIKRSLILLLGAPSKVFFEMQRCHILVVLPLAPAVGVGGGGLGFTLRLIHTDVVPVYSIAGPSSTNMTTIVNASTFTGVVEVVGVNCSLCTASSNYYTVNVNTAITASVWVIDALSAQYLWCEPVGIVLSSVGAIRTMLLSVESVSVSRESQLGNSYCDLAMSTPVALLAASAWSFFLQGPSVVTMTLRNASLVNTSIAIVNANVDMLHIEVVQCTVVFTLGSTGLVSYHAFGVSWDVSVYLVVRNASLSLHAVSPSMIQFWNVNSSGTCSILVLDGTSIASGDADFTVVAWASLTRWNNVEVRVVASSIALTDDSSRVLQAFPSLDSILRLDAMLFVISERSSITGGVFFSASYMYNPSNITMSIMDGSLVNVSSGIIRLDTISMSLVNVFLGGTFATSIVIVNSVVVCMQSKKSASLFPQLAGQNLSAPLVYFTTQNAVPINHFVFSVSLLVRVVNATVTCSGLLNGSFAPNPDARYLGALALTVFINVERSSTVTLLPYLYSGVTGMFQAVMSAIAPCLVCLMMNPSGGTTVLSFQRLEVACFVTEDTVVATSSLDPSKMQGALLHFTAINSITLPDGLGFSDVGVFVTDRVRVVETQVLALVFKSSLPGELQGGILQNISITLSNGVEIRMSGNLVELTGFTASSNSIAPQVGNIHINVTDAAVDIGRGNVFALADVSVVAVSHQIFVAAAVVTFARSVVHCEGNVIQLSAMSVLRFSTGLAVVSAWDILVQGCNVSSRSMVQAQNTSVAAFGMRNSTCAGSLLNCNDVSELDVVNSSVVLVAGIAVPRTYFIMMQTPLLLNTSANFGRRWNLVASNFTGQAFGLIDFPDTRSVMLVVQCVRYGDPPAVALLNSSSDVANVCTYTTSGFGANSSITVTGGMLCAASGRDLRTASSSVQVTRSGSSVTDSLRQLSITDDATTSTASMSQTIQQIISLSHAPTETKRLMPSHSRAGTQTHNSLVSASTSLAIERPPPAGVVVLSSTLAATSFQSTAAATSVLVVSSVLSGAAAVDAGAMAALGLMSCASASGGMRKSAGPLVYLLSPFADLGSAAMVVGNAGLAVAVVIVQVIVVCVVLLRGSSHDEAAARARFPHIALVGASLLLQGVVRGWVAVVTGPSWGVLSVVAAIFGPLYVGFVYLAWLRGVQWVARTAEFTSGYKQASVAWPRWAAWLFLPVGDWLPVESTRRFGALFQNMRGMPMVCINRWILAHGAVFVAVSAVDATTGGNTGCAAQYFTLALLAGGMLAVVGWRRPFKTEVVNMLTVVNYSCVTAIALLLGIDALHPLPSAPSVTSGIAIAQSVSMIVKSIHAIAIHVVSVVANGAIDSAFDRFRVVPRRTFFVHDGALSVSDVIAVCRSMFDPCRPNVASPSSKIHDRDVSVEGESKREIYLNVFKPSRGDRNRRVSLSQHAVEAVESLRAVQIHQQEKMLSTLREVHQLLWKHTARGGSTSIIQTQSQAQVLHTMISGICIDSLLSKRIANAEQRMSSCMALTTQVEKY